MIEIVNTDYLSLDKLKKTEGIEQTEKENSQALKKAETETLLL